MAVIYDLEHITTYRYANPVTFGVHRAMFVPRPAGYRRILSFSVKTSLPARIRWLSDTLSNIVAVMEFSEPGQELTFTFHFRGIHYGGKGVEEFPLEPRAEEVPVQYTALIKCPFCPIAPNTQAAYSEIWKNRHSEKCFVVVTGPAGPWRTNEQVPPVANGRSIPRHLISRSHLA